MEKPTMVQRKGGADAPFRFPDSEPRRRHPILPLDIRQAPGTVPCAGNLMAIAT